MWARVMPGVMRLPVFAAKGNHSKVGEKMSGSYNENQMTRYGYILVVTLIAFAAMIVSCKMESQDKRNQKVADKWKKPSSIVPPAGEDLNSKRVRTYVYWSDLNNLIDSMYDASLGDDGKKPQNLAEVGGIVCGLVAEEINKLPTDSVDEDAINAGQKVYASLLKAKTIYTEWGVVAEGLKDDPGAFGKDDPGHSFGAGVSVVQKQKALERETQIELSKVRALLESRYKGFKFKMPHEFN